MIPGIYRVQPADLRNSVALKYIGNIHNSIFTIRDSVYYFDIAIARTTAIAASTLLAEFEMFKDIQVNVPEAERTRICMTFVSIELPLANSATASLYHQIRMNYNGQLYSTDAIAANMGVLIQGVFSTAGKN